MSPAPLDLASALHAICLAAIAKGIPRAEILEELNDCLRTVGNIGPLEETMIRGAARKAGLR